MMKPNRRAGCGCLILIGILVWMARNSGSNQRILPTIAVLPSLTPVTPQIAQQPTHLPATEPPTVTIIETAAPSATITDTATPTQALPTLSPAPTNAPPEIWYTVSLANLRSCASLTCDQIVRLEGGTALSVIGFEQGETYRGSDIWRVVDYAGQRVYVHSSLVSVSPPQPAVAPVQIIYPTSTGLPVVQPPQPVNPGLQCPSNCAEAVALGWTAEQAGQCSNLDRDHDGVACYGD